MIFVVFLPPLLNYAAFFSSPREPRSSQTDRSARHRPRTLHDGGYGVCSALPYRHTLGRGVRAGRSSRLPIRSLPKRSLGGWGSLDGLAP